MELLNRRRGDFKHGLQEDASVDEDLAAFASCTEKGRFEAQALNEHVYMLALWHSCSSFIEKEMTSSKSAHQMRADPVLCTQYTCIRGKGCSKK